MNGLTIDSTENRYQQPKSFSSEAVTILLSAIEQRRKLFRKGVSRVQFTPQISSVFATFDAFKYKWSVQGVARFLLNYETTIRLIIPTSNPLLMQRYEALLPFARKYANLN